MKRKSRKCDRCSTREAYSSCDGCSAVICESCAGYDGLCGGGFLCRACVATRCECGRTLDESNDHRLEPLVRAVQNHYSPYCLDCFNPRWFRDRVMQWSGIVDSATRSARAAARKRRAESPKGPVVYFLRGQTTGRIKIGTTEDLRDRVASIRTMSADRIEIVAFIKGDRQLELELHTRFRTLRLHGEWFEPGPDLLAYIETIRKKRR